MLTLQGRTCVYAGATGAIGHGVVRALAEGGMNVVMVTHNPASAAAMVEEMKHLPGQVTAMSNENGDGSVFGAVAERFGSVDVVINSTGGFDAVVPLEAITPEALDKKLHHQVTGYFAMVQSAIPYLEKSRAGRVILMTSAGAQDGYPGENMADSIARGAVITMTYCLARALAGRGVTVNAIAKSGVVNDHPPRDAGQYDVATVAGSIPVGHVGTSEELAALVSYLASEEAAFVTGQVMGFSGGLHIG